MTAAEEPATAEEPVTAAPQVEVLVSVADGALADVTEKVRAAGGVLLEQMPELGTVSFSLPEDQIDSLGDVEGVEAVERSRTYQLPPPDSPVQ